MIITIHLALNKRTRLQLRTTCRCHAGLTSEDVRRWNLRNVSSRWSLAWHPRHCRQWRWFESVKNARNDVDYPCTVRCIEQNVVRRELRELNLWCGQSIFHSKIFMWSRFSYDAGFQSSA